MDSKKPVGTVGKKVFEISEGVLAKVVDLTLVSVFFSLEFATSGYGGTYKAGDKANLAISEFNYQTIKRSITYLKKNGLVQSVKTKNNVLLPKITKAGKKRIKAMIPQYDEQRVWDEKIYLVTYDFPTKRNNDRNKLREFLKKIGCGMLQHSVWLTPYNPKEMIEKFISNQNLDDELIIVSSVGKDGTIGETDIFELLDKVYCLSKLNTRYMEFVVLAKKGELTKEQAVFTFLSILKSDPQLPFVLLPKDWQGKTAYQMYKSAII